MMNCAHGTSSRYCVVARFHSLGDVFNPMAFLFKSVFRAEKTAVLTPPPEVPADLNLVPPQFPAPQVPIAAPSAEPVVNEAAVLQDFLIKNFLLDEPSAETATPVVPLSYARMPEPLARHELQHRRQP